VGGALAPVAAVTSSHQGLPVGCLWFTHDLSGAWQERNGDHVWEKRCSRLDLLGCDLGPGYAARDLRTRESEVAYGSLRLRDGVLAAPSSSPVVCRIVGAPPLCAPARVIPGRTLWEGEGRVGSRAPPSTSKYAFWALVEALWRSCSRTSKDAVSAMLLRRFPPPLEVAEPTVSCAGCMDLQTAASAGQPEPCPGLPSGPTR
jgi:hypothetical protein